MDIIDHDQTAGKQGGCEIGPDREINCAASENILVRLGYTRYVGHDLTPTPQHRPRGFNLALGELRFLAPSALARFPDASTSVPAFPAFPIPPFPLSVPATRCSGHRTLGPALGCGSRRLF